MQKTRLRLGTANLHCLKYLKMIDVKNHITPASGAAEVTGHVLKAIKHLMLLDNRSRELPLSLARSC